VGTPGPPTVCCFVMRVLASCAQCGACVHGRVFYNAKWLWKRCAHRPHNDLQSTPDSHATIPVDAVSGAEGMSAGAACRFLILVTWIMEKSWSGSGGQSGHNRSNTNSSCSPEVLQDGILSHQASAHSCKRVPATHPGFRLRFVVFSHFSHLST
jgi:hypothetical protein